MASLRSDIKYTHIIELVIFNPSMHTLRWLSIKYEMPKSIERHDRTHPLLVEGANTSDHSERDVGNVLISHFA